MKRFSTAALAIAATGLIAGSASAATFTNHSSTIDITEVKTYDIRAHGGISTAWDAQAFPMDFANGTLYVADQKINGQSTNIVAIDGILGAAPTTKHIATTFTPQSDGNHMLNGLAADGNGNVVVTYRKSAWNYAGEATSFVAGIDTNNSQQLFYKNGVDAGADPTGAAYNAEKDTFNFIAQGHNNLYNVATDGTITDGTAGFLPGGGVAMALDFDSEGNAASIYGAASGAMKLLYHEYDATTDTFTTSVIKEFTSSFADGYEVEIINGVTGDPMFAVSNPWTMTFDGETTAPVTATIFDAAGGKVATVSEGKQGSKLSLAYDADTQTLFAAPAYNKEVIVYNLAAVPEPASMALLGLGGLLVLGRRRK
ncbi:PEP-CTERM sorting domain-containing protein [Poriferisphaera sp. WC338]|uniref:PEP-CTERM sorting domain-containing protein n=1 Tax=Poriferisphaera sp. WC338 TaxID=3425129 RepID=UPI003D815099